MHRILRNYMFSKTLLCISGISGGLFLFWKYKSFVYKSNAYALFKNYFKSLNLNNGHFQIFYNNKIARCHEVSNSISSNDDIIQPRKPYIGLSIRPLKPEKGMLIVLVKSDSPGEKAGLKSKDVILEINGHGVSTINEYNAAVGYEIGKKILKILRNEHGEEKIYEIEVDYIVNE
jgi:hypothetical protein